MTGTIEQRVEELVKPLIESMGLEVWGIRYRGGKDSAVLQIFIECEEGVNADMCGDVTNLISPALDAADIINPAYILEVSSPGLDRILFNLDQARLYIGKRIKLELNVAMQSRRKFDGVLLQIEEPDILVLDDKLSGQIKLAFSNVAIARLVPEFNNASKKK